ncbi:MAG: LysM domain-containing protein [Thermoanaerobacterales bacterium]|nr:LysM domain-containing protein [Bacillota bacterium]MDI6906940.1 LysM domain-containing protein [Thermoanaerobacterales bacterium]
MHYTVRDGDTLDIICRRFKVREDDVLRFNPHLRKIRRLRPGQVIVIPIHEFIEECPVPPPPIERFVPPGATVVVRTVRLSGRRVPERVIIFTVETPTGPETGIVVIRFTCERGWFVVFRRLNIRLRLRFITTVRILDDDREQVVIGTTTGPDQALSFILLGWAGGRVVVLDRLNVRFPQGAVFVRDRRLIVRSGPRVVTFTWSGTEFVEG